jgi:ABC-type Mn2+/Zn2+ transport system ATPase subunit
MQITDLIMQHRFTILLGKNGAGKSSILRRLDGQGSLETRYITPERGGELKYEPNVDSSIASSPDWLAKVRRRNRSENFRQQSAAQFRNLEMLYLREIEKNEEKRKDLNHTFDSVIDRLNKFLPAIRLVRSDRGFSIQDLAGSPISEGEISSGESEFIAQAIELLVYSRSDQTEKILLLDEPDVHLHPDLQSKFVQLIEEVAIEQNMRVVIATHSTAILSGFSNDADLQIVPISNRGQREFESFSREKVSDELLPIFGAHPLSTMFNRLPLLLVEGEDDHRIVEQAVRSSRGRILLNPCVVGSVDEMGRWEIWLEKFLPALYDDPVAYSLRDLDDAEESEIADLEIVKRARLNCYAMENLLLTDDSLERAGSDSQQLLNGLRLFLKTYPDHRYANEIANLVEHFAERRTLKIKDVRNVVLAVIGITKPWEVHVGQLLASNWVRRDSEHSLSHYLGPKARALFNREG